MTITMRAVALAAGLAAALVARAPAYADAGETAEEVVGETHEVPRPSERDAEANKEWVEYGKSVGNRYMVGLNSLITFPADPVMDTVKPREEFNELPLAAGTKYIAGLGTGLMLSVYRATMGAFDVLCAPLTPMKMLSPEPRYMIFPNAQHEEY
jgi:hypothetical protein